MKRIPLCLLLGTTLGCAPAFGLGRLADVSVIDRDTNRSLPVYYAQGSYWVAGTPGARYGIDVHNKLGERVLTVISVDGVNAVSGETASIEQTGYVLGADERYQITGWRKSAREVAAFQFTASPQSYAERTGRAANVGVLGIAVFRERLAAPPSPPLPVPYALQERNEDRAARAAAPSSAPAQAAGVAAERPTDASAGTSVMPPMRFAPKLGTGHGERETSVVGQTEFERASERPDEVIRIRYDSYERLVALGVIRRPAPRLPQPDAFPGSPLLGYVPDPPR